MKVALATLTLSGAVLLASGVNVALVQSGNARETDTNEIASLGTLFFDKGGNGTFSSISAFWSPWRSIERVAVRHCRHSCLI